MNRSDFEAIVEQAWNDLPEQFRRHLNNVSIIVEEWPDTVTLDEVGEKDPMMLLGFYRGIPLPDRSDMTAMELPDQIYLYRQPILHLHQTNGEIRRAIRDTLQHEIAHHFGFDDEELEEMGVY